MQLKGLIRFFTILLIIYSIYELSFTWVVRSHEKKMETRAQSFVNNNYKNADAATKQQAYQDRLKDYWTVQKMKRFITDLPVKSAIKKQKRMN